MIGCAVNPNTSVAEENRTAMTRSHIVDRKDRQEGSGRKSGEGTRYSKTTQTQKRIGEGAKRRGVRIFHFGAAADEHAAHLREAAALEPTSNNLISPI